MYTTVARRAKLSLALGLFWLFAVFNLPGPISLAQAPPNGGGSVSSNGTVITIRGTRFDDRATVALSANRIVVILNSSTSRFDQSGIERIEFFGFNGNDFFRNQSPVFAIAKGGSGNDRLVTTVARAEFWGNAGNDELIGGSEDDALFGNPGDDRLVGNGGADHLDGGSDDDTFFGGVGDDTIFDQSGADWVNGGGGDDFIQTMSDADTIYGGGGDDTIRAGDGADDVHGGNGNDTILGGEGNDKVYGDAGDDRLFGDQGNDLVLGWNGNDQLEGGPGNDRLDGGADTDLIFGDEGQDILIGSNGDDTMHGGLGDDQIQAGSGIDTVGLTGNFEAYDFTVFNANSLLAVGPDGRDTIENTEFLQFADRRVTTDSVVKTTIDLLNDVLPNGWDFRSRITSNDVWFESYSPGGTREFRFRFGAGGAIGNLLDGRSGQQLLAPSYNGEVTDRVIQWTLWDENVRYNHPDLSTDNDRYNLTQAGTFRNLLSGTTQASLGSNSLDVWAVVNRQWRSELDPHIRGEVTSLTRSTRLDAGALLIRRVIRVGPTFLNNSRRTLTYPYFEAWTPFSDSVFNSVALDINGRGQPTKWYADSINVPRYDNTPAAQTRGWAVVYDRNRLTSGVAVGVVYGRDRGLVHRSDGTQTRTSQLVLNLLDFQNGLAVLPGLYGEVIAQQNPPVGLPEGSVIDQYILLVPSRGISGNGPGTLNALSDLIPAPQIYHPGSTFLDSDLTAISNRLRTLRNEQATRTDNLAKLLN